MCVGVEVDVDADLLQVVDRGDALRLLQARVVEHLDALGRGVLDEFGAAEDGRTVRLGDVRGPGGRVVGVVGLLLVVEGEQQRVVDVEDDRGLLVPVVGLAGRLVDVPLRGGVEARQVLGVRAVGGRLVDPVAVGRGAVVGVDVLDEDPDVVGLVRRVRRGLTGGGDAGAVQGGTGDDTGCGDGRYAQ